MYGEPDFHSDFTTIKDTLRFRYKFSSYRPRWIATVARRSRPRSSKTTNRTTKQLRKNAQELTVNHPRRYVLITIALALSLIFKNGVPSFDEHFCKVPFVPYGIRRVRNSIKRFGSPARSLSTALCSLNHDVAVGIISINNVAPKMAGRYATPVYTRVHPCTPVPHHTLIFELYKRPQLFASSSHSLSNPLANRSKPLV